MFKYIGKVLIAFAILLLVPILVSVIYNENITVFLIPFCFSLGFGILLSNLKSNKTMLYAKDGLIIVSIAWILISILGAIPFYAALDISFIDALFETVSGFSTTGATIFVGGSTFTVAEVL